MMQKDRSTTLEDVVPIVGKIEFRSDDLTRGRGAPRVVDVRLLDQDKRVQAGVREELRRSRWLARVLSPNVIAVEDARGARVEHRFQVSVVECHWCFPSRREPTVATPIR